MVDNYVTTLGGHGNDTFLINGQYQWVNADDEAQDFAMATLANDFGGYDVITVLPTSLVSGYPAANTFS